MKSFSILLLASVLGLVSSFAPNPIISRQRVLSTPTEAFLFGFGKKDVEESSQVTTLEPPSDAEETKEQEIPMADSVKATEVGDECDTPEEMSETQKLMKQVKESGTAGIISYALWELGFWFVSVPFCIFAYREVTGHWPDLSNSDDQAKLGAEAFAFVNFARFAVPLRIGLALSTTPWINKNIVEKYLKKEEEEVECDPTSEQ